MPDRFTLRGCSGAPRKGETLQETARFPGLGLRVLPRAQEAFPQFLKSSNP